MTPPKTQIKTGLILLFLLLVSAQAKGQTIFSAGFDTGTDGFTYSDDAFRATANPAYTRGSHSTVDGFTGGRINVFMGGTDNVSVPAMSGGWFRNFTLGAAGTVTISLRYRLYFTKSYEGDECAQALVSVDGILRSPAAEQDFLRQFCGANPNFANDQDSGWQQVTIRLNLSAGSHTITVGGWNNKKDSINEFTNVLFDDIIVVTGSSLPTPTPAPTPLPTPRPIFSANFDDGNTSEWTVVADSGTAPNWRVISGEFDQLNVVGRFVQSFHTGTYAYYNRGLGLTDYQVTLDVIPIEGRSAGVMFRYRDNDNYYRFSISRAQGFSRLEKKVNGVFHTLASNGRGPALFATQKITIQVAGSKILVYMNGAPLFSAIDSSLSIGTIALYSLDAVSFDNVLVKENNSARKVIVSSPNSFSVAAGSTLDVSAVAMNVPPGGGVRFSLDGVPLDPADYTEPYTARFSGVRQGNHNVAAVMVGSSGQPFRNRRAKDKNRKVGIRGNYIVAMGDSITNGIGDNFSGDDNSVDGRNLSRGWTPILNDLLSGALGRPILIANEGMGGTESGGDRPGAGTSRLVSTIDRHPESQFWLILFGTNDSAGSLPVPSGKGLRPGNNGYAGSFKDNMQRIITELKRAGKTPLIAKVPFALNVPASRDRIIRDYNVVIDELKTLNGITAVPPDFYNFFKQRPEQFADDLHPNGEGYISMANLWFDALIESGVLDP